MSPSSSISSSDSENLDEDTSQKTVPTSESIIETIQYLLIFLLGLATFFLLVSDFMCTKTYFSDNSLLPGLVQREFSFDHEAVAIFDDLNSMTTKEHSKHRDKYSKSLLVSDYLSKKLKSFGLLPYTQKFQYKQRFLSKPNDEPPTLSGKNIYSIIRSERAQTSEAVVLCAPYSYDGQLTNLPGISLILALTKYFVTRNYWSKDVIILFTDYNFYGTSAWLDAYHNVNFLSNNTNLIGIDYEPLDYRSGPILAAINLELHGKQTDHINIKIEGMNGQLPNLDLFNLVVEMAARESITPKFHGQSFPFSISGQELYLTHLSSVLSMMRTQASMALDGAHGLFQKYSIQSLTLEGFEYKKNKDAVVLASLLNVGRLIEGIFRSLNNLIERFNRSYYFYLLPSLRRFVSIGYYMIAFGLMILPLVLKSLRIYKNGLVYNERQRTRKNESKLNNSEDKIIFNLWQGAASCAKAQLFGSILFVLPSLIMDFTGNLQFDYKLTLGELTSFGMIISSLILPILYQNQRHDPDVPSARLLAALLNLALALVVISLFNISLAFFLSFVMVPISLLVTARKNIISRNLNRISLIFVHPLILGLLSVIIYNQVRNQELNFLDNVKQSSVVVGRSVSSFTEQFYLFGNWAFMVGPLIYPVWIQLWSMP